MIVKGTGNEQEQTEQTGTDENRREQTRTDSDRKRTRTMIESVDFIA